MKALASILVLLTLCACRREENVWNELSASEREAARQLAQENCLRDTEDKYNQFKRESEDVYTSSNWERGDGWIHQLKEGSTVQHETKVMVWKNQGNEIYLVLHSKPRGGGTTQSMLRITAASNADAIDALQEMECGRTVEAGSGLTIKDTYYTSLGNDQREKREETYSFARSHLAWMGGSYHLRRTTSVVDEDGETVSGEETITLTSTFSRMDEDDVALPSVNTVATAFAGSYCEPEASHALPYTTTCYATPVAAGWDLTL